MVPRRQFCDSPGQVGNGCQQSLLVCVGDAALLGKLLVGATTLLGTVFFPPEQLPPLIQGLSNWVPLTWSLRVVRGSLLQGKTFAELQNELTVLVLLTVVLLPSGLLASRIAIRRAKKEGTLVHY